MLLYHAIRKTYDDFDEVYQYRIDGEKVWEMNEKKYFSHNTADEIVVRGRVPRE